MVSGVMLSVAKHLICRVGLLESVILRFAQNDKSRFQR